jgi:hypothetical protein
MQPRIVVISPTTRVVSDVSDAFQALWPQGNLAHIVDETIYHDVLGRKMGFTPGVKQRVLALLKQGEAAEAKAMMFTGSIFGALIEELRVAVAPPVTTSSQGLIEEIFSAPAKGEMRRIGIVSTVAQSIADLERDMARFAGPQGLQYSIEKHVAADARPLFESGERGKHDTIVVAACHRFRDVDILVLPQFSLTSAHAALPDVAGRTALCASRSAIGLLKRLSG